MEREETGKNKVRIYQAERGKLGDNIELYGEEKNSRRTCRRVKKEG